MCFLPLNAAWSRLTTATLLILSCGVGCGCRFQPQRVTFEEAGERPAVDSEVDPPATEEPEIEAATVAPEAPTPSVELQTRMLAATVGLELQEGYGSGVILDREDDTLVILTVWHVAREGVQWVNLFDPLKSLRRPTVRLPGPKLISHSERLDLALYRLRVPAELETSQVKLASAAPKVSGPFFAYSLGCHTGPPSLLTEQILNDRVFQIVDNGTRHRRRMWTSRVPQEEGRSGGGLMDVDGALIGVALGKQRSAGFYCHFQEIADYLIDSGLKSLVRCDASDKYDE